MSRLSFNTVSINWQGIRRYFRTKGMSESVRIILLDLLGLYKLIVSPLLPAACRFEPTCSEYAREAVEKHGAIRGTWMGLMRILRCQPLCKGGLDPVK